MENLTDLDNLASLPMVREANSVMWSAESSRDATADVYLCQLGFVESGPGLQLVVSLVASQSVDLQLEQVHLTTAQTHCLIRVTRKQ